MRVNLSEFKKEINREIFSCALGCVVCVPIASDQLLGRTQTQKEQIKQCADRGPMPGIGLHSLQRLARNCFRGCAFRTEGSGNTAVGH